LNVFPKGLVYRVFLGFVFPDLLCFREQIVVYGQIGRHDLLFFFFGFFTQSYV
jgi:hypothetical protein